MKLYVEEEFDSVNLVFPLNADGEIKKVGENVVVFLAKDGRVAHLIIKGVSNLLGGRRLQDLKLVLEPLPSSFIELTEEQDAKIRQKLAERENPSPAPRG